MYRTIDYILRASVAFAFLYPAINAIFAPYSWIGYFPAFTRDIVSDAVLLHSFGAIEVVLALWILSGWRAFYPAVMAAVMLVVIMAFNWYEFPVLFRDLSIVGAALALAVMHAPARFRPAA